MRKIIFISICTLLFYAVPKAQDKKYVYEDSTLNQSEDSYDNTSEVETATVVEQVADTLFVDTTVYYNRLTISPDTVEVWKNLKAFAYVKHLDSLLKAEKEKRKEKKEEKTYTAPSGPSALERFLSSSGLQFFLWMLAACFVLFILYKLFLTEGAFRKRTTSLKNTSPQVEEEVITSESDFERLIRLAIQSGNYRLAVRYQYLQTLHKLAAKNLIELAADKTNNNYVREITNKNYQNDFAALTLNYEYVWYGEFAIEENIYRRLETGFSQFNSKL
jgi:hypothetical protein